MTLTTSPLRSEAHPPDRPPRTLWGRRAWAYLALLVWALLIGGIAPQAANLGQVVESGAAAYLPGSSQSAQVAHAVEAFGDEPATPAVVVWTADRPLTPADHAGIDGQLTRLRTDLGDVITGAGVIGPIPSEDGRAVQAVVPLAGTDAEAAAAHVDQIRSAVRGGDGLQVAVTGPAGITADMQAALGAVDLMLVAVTTAVILVILLAVYRSLVLPLLVITVGVLALGVTHGALYLLAKAGVITIGAEVQGIISVLVLGCATDYALLLVDRFARELRAGRPSAQALGAAWRGCVEPVVASAATVVLGLSCLLLSDLGLNRQLGPAAAVGVLIGMLAMLTLLPAVLRLLGPRAFWPRHPERAAARPRRGLTGLSVPVLRRHPRTVWAGLTVILALLAGAAGGLHAGGLTDNDMVIGDGVESRTGQDRLRAHFGADLGSPAVVLVDADRLDAARQAAERVPGVSSTRVWTVDGLDRPVEVAGRVRFDALLTEPPDSDAAIGAVHDLRQGLGAVGGDPLVGGQTAVRVDFNQAAQDDRRVLVLLLAVVLVVVCLLLRSIVAGLVIVASVALSFGAALGVSTLVFQNLLGMPGVDASFPIHAFVFLVALGVDYSIFLMSRVREQVLELGPRGGVLAGLTQTSGVITSAGIVLAATFAALGLVPLVLMVQLAFIVAFGVLLDTFVVRSLLVPALALDLGPRMWWPNRRLSRAPETLTR